MRSLPILSLALAGLLINAAGAPAATVFVNPGAAGPRTGASWANGLATVAAGLSAASAGDEVWVLAGTYKENLTMKSGVGLYGGFKGTETARAQRNPAANVTTLDGDKKGAVIFVGRAATGTVINGFTIRNGIGTLFLDEDNRPSTAGGGLTIFGDADLAQGPNNVEVSGNILTGNSVGGPLGRGAAVYVKGYSQARIVGNTILANGDPQSGEGMVYVEGFTLECSPLVANNRITANQGHAIVSEIASPTIANNLIDNNIGDGILVRNLKKSTTVTITGNTIVENRPRDESAAWDGYGVYVMYGGTTKLANNIIAWNGGGGIGHQFGMVIEARSNCVYGNNFSNFSTSSSTTPNPLPGNGNILVNPRLASMPYDDYHLRHDSPCRNAGDAASVVDTPDMDGQARVQGGAVDIGYDESDGTVYHPGYNVVRVKTDGADANTGATWAQAKKSIQAGVSQAGPGGEVWVGKGTYTERVSVPQSVLTYAGFAGTETERNQRNWKANAVTLDGGGVGTPYSIRGGSTAVAAFEGFTVQNSNDAGSGIGIARSPLATISLRDNTIRRNGYGITAYGSGPLIADSVITENSQDAIYLNGPGDAIHVPDIHNNVIHRNLGAGIYVYSGPATIANNQVTRNGSDTYDAAISLDIGGSAATTLSNNTVAANSGFGLYIRSGSNVQLVNNIVAWNRYNGIWKWSGLTTVQRNNCVYGNVGYDYANFSADPTGSDGNINVNPGFASVPYDDFHIRHDSPCRDAGDNAAAPSGTQDVDFQARVQGARVDIGADESNGAQYDPLLTIVRVKPNGDDAQDGSTWARAKKTVQAGMDVALGGELWVAAGTYQHVGELYTNYLTLPPNIPVYGGFLGTETRRDQRDFVGNETLLHGGNTGTVLTVAGGVTAPTVLDGFVVTGSAEFGTAIRIESNEDFQISIVNNVLHNNKHGISAFGASPTIAGNLIYYNTGTAVSVQACPDPSVLNNIFYRNGENGLNITDSSGRYANNLIADNGAGQEFSEAVGVSLGEPGHRPSIENNTVVRNGGWGVNSTGPGQPLYVNNIIAWNGKGFRVDDQAPSLRNNCLYGNRDANTTGFTTDPIGANGNISADPRFASAAFADYHIRPDSPCRDTGDTSVVRAGEGDYDGQARVLNAKVDIGVDESDGSTYPANYNAIHVRPTGDDAKTGSSWADAKKTVQAALAGGAGVEVWVASGTYTNASTDEYGEYLVVHAHQGVYGGFAGTETERAQRNPKTNPTVLDGNHKGSSVVTFEGRSTAPTVLDGFVVRNSSDYAPGVKVPETGRFIVRNNHIHGCNSGVDIEAGSPDVWNNTVTGNTRGIESMNSSPDIRNNVVTGNQAEGIYLSGEGSPTVVSNTVARNSPADYSGALYVDSASKPLVVNNIVAFNTSGVYGHDAAFTMRHNNVFGNNGLDYQYVANPTGANGNISADPRFVNADGGDFHLAAGSPCVDQGEGTSMKPGEVDMDRQARKAGAAPDIGADEFGSTVPVSIGDVRTALAASAGLHRLTTDERNRLDVDTAGASQSRVDLRDAIQLLRAMLRDGG